MPPKTKGSPKGRGSKSITTFFKPVTASQSQPSPSQQSKSQTPKPWPSSKVSPRQLSSSPEFPDLGLGTPAKECQQPPQPRRDVIAASDDDADDDDDSSDGGFMDFMSTSGPGKPAPATCNLETPRAKRTMSATHVSPLTINTKPHVMFDMKALARDAKIDDATNASSTQLRELVAETEKEESNLPTSFGSSNIKDVVQDQGGQHAHKVMRAVHRAGEQAAPHFHFFRPGFKQPGPPSAPTNIKNSTWKLLMHNDLHTREQYVVSGMPYTILRRAQMLPDEVFEWVLDDLSSQNSRLLAQEYCTIISCCPDQVKSLITSQRLAQIFVRLGAADEGAPVEDQHTVIRPAEAQYKGRDWCSLHYVLKLIADIAPHMELEAFSYAANTLLRLSMDRFLICNMDLLMEYEATMRSLLLSLTDNATWDAFCLECCKSLQSGFKTQSIRLNALLALPVDNRRAHDLRRRLATAFMFEDPSRGAQTPSTYMTLRRLVDRLDQDDFVINAKTDFDELRARIIILDMIIDDGSFVPSGDVDEEKNFNVDVDELASKLRGFWTKINDSGLKLSRAQTKSVVEWVQQRISLSVRTRQKVRKDIYDIVLGDDPFLPRQQTLMKEFLGKKVRD